MSPGQLAATEVATIKNMVLTPEYRHMPLGTLARYAERIGKVFASASTWAKLVRERGWRRPSSTQAHRRCSPEGALSP